jgi:hypothetical protein
MIDANKKFHLQVIIHDARKKKTPLNIKVKMVQVCSKAMTKLKKKKMPLLNHQKNIRIKHFVKSLILIYSFYFGH